MATMNVSLPDALREFVEQQVSRGGYGTSSEYVRDLIRREQERQGLRAMLLEGAQSGVVAEPDAHYFAALRSRAAPARTAKARGVKSGAKRRA